MNYFEKCQHCKPPERYPGCQDHCEHYKEGRARLDADNAKRKEGTNLYNYVIERHVSALDSTSKYIKRRPNRHSYK